MEIYEQGSSLFYDSDIDSEYANEKQEKKKKIIRNEFEVVGKYGMPLVKKQTVDLAKIELWNFCKAKANDTEYQHKTITFSPTIGTLKAYIVSPSRHLKNLIIIMRF